MKVKEYYFKALKKLADDTESEQVNDYKPRQKADHDYLFKTINNSYKLDSRDHRLYAEQIKVNEERNK